MIMVVVPQDLRKIAKYSHSHDNFKCADAKCIASSATYIKQSHFGCHVSFPHVANWVSFMPMSILDVISGFSRRRVIKFASFFVFFLHSHCSLVLAFNGLILSWNGVLHMWP